jgi:dolichol-phosphate mannosyltransferase
MSKTISVIIPSFNEEANIVAAVDNVLKAIAYARLDDYEVILFNDCSTDKTGQIIDGLAAENSKIRAVHNKVNMGFGFNFNKGVELARKDYISILPGDNEIELRGIKAMFEQVGVADIIVPYVINRNVRSISRRIISSVYVFVMNLFFACGLRYYTGPAVLKADILKQVPLKTNDFAFMSVVLIRTIRQGRSFIEVPIYIRSRIGGKSKAFKIKNIISVISTILKLFWEVNIVGRGKYSKKPNMVRCENI